MLIRGQMELPRWNDSKKDGSGPSYGLHGSHQGTIRNAIHQLGSCRGMPLLAYHGAWRLMETI